MRSDIYTSESSRRLRAGTRPQIEPILVDALGDPPAAVSPAVPVVVTCCRSPYFIDP